jgi:hypothetical protein
LLSLRESPERLTECWKLIITHRLGVLEYYLKHEVIVGAGTVCAWKLVLIPEQRVGVFPLRLIMKIKERLCWNFPSKSIGWPTNKIDRLAWKTLPLLIWPRNREIAIMGAHLPEVYDHQSGGKKEEARRRRQVGSLNYSMFLLRTCTTIIMGGI